MPRYFIVLSCVYCKHACCCYKEMSPWGWIQHLQSTLNGRMKEVLIAAVNESCAEPVLAAPSSHRSASCWAGRQGHRQQRCDSASRSRSSSPHEASSHSPSFSFYSFLPFLHCSALIIQTRVPRDKRIDKSKHWSILLSSVSHFDGDRNIYRRHRFSSCTFQSKFLS